MAIAEHDRLGLDAFLKRYGFALGEYFLRYADQLYASKAIVGAAHGYAKGRPLLAAEFSGGADTVQPALEGLGFQVVHVSRRNLPWTREEVILACDLVVKNDWWELRTNDPKVQELSAQLRGMTIYPHSRRLENFRSADAVSRKTSDLMTANPSYTGATTRGGKVDRAVVDEFLADPEGMTALAAEIRSGEAGPVSDHSP